MAVRHREFLRLRLQMWVAVWVVELVAELVAGISLAAHPNSFRIGDPQLCYRKYVLGSCNP
ncbi:hypothetical protein K440DRAFT_620515 [Wilcoxina mikolae CBS 423.85]|nr:hypothetical protein K440DRAFT_620515 [Wilcoxina mikolae CBS 423.85]